LGPYGLQDRSTAQTNVLCVHASQAGLSGASTS
jgi:hypothetical protein